MRTPGRLATLFVGACALSSGVALADPPDPSPPPASTPIPTVVRLRSPFGEPTGDPLALPPALSVLPLRLSLLSDAFPIAEALGDGGCASSLEANGRWGFPLQHQVFMALTPRLVLHGFSRLGCTLDAGVGGGLTYTVPLAEKLWVVGSLGGYTLPSQQPGVPLARPDARVDLLWQTAPQHVLGVGLDRKGVKITGTW